MLTAKELTQSALDFITQQVKQMVAFAMDNTEEEVKMFLIDQGLELDISNCFKDLCSPFKDWKLSTCRISFMNKNVI